MKSGALALVTILGLASCAAPSHRAVEEPVIRPSEVTDFALLYRQNCSGCHGVDGRGGLSVAVGDPVYLAIADDASIRRITAEGVPGTAMPAFAQKAGGMLTDAQVAIIVHGMRAHWATPGAFDKDKPPAWASSQPGDAARGHDVFTTACSSCHGPAGGARQLVDNPYLALVSDQHLRTVTIIGMPQLGMPNWRNHGKPLSDSDVTDVVAWLSEQRALLSSQLHPSGGSQ